MRPSHSAKHKVSEINWPLLTFFVSNFTSLIFTVSLCLAPLVFPFIVFTVSLLLNTSNSIYKKHN